MVQISSRHISEVCLYCTH